MDKQRIKSLLYSYEVRVVSIISSGVVSRASKHQILKKVRDETLRIKLKPDEQNRMWQFATSFYRHCVAAAGRKTELQDRAEKVYAVLRADTPLLEHQKNELADSVEFRIKHQNLVDMLSGEQNFFYCTAHKNPACGHAAYQDRIYFRKNGHLSPEEEEFAYSKGLLAVEDVVMAPIYLTTRKNCKHRLIPISFNSAKRGDVRGEVYSHDISYEEEQYANYSDRLRMLVNVKKALTSIGAEPSAQMKVDIRRTYSLVRAWKAKMKKAQD